MTTYHHILFSGFLQKADNPHGMMRIYQDLNTHHAGHGVYVTLNSWWFSAREIANRVKKLRNGGEARIAVYGYSLGGGQAVECCRQLERRGIMVDHLCLCDPVKRVWCLPLTASSLLPLTHHVPGNVVECHWYRQTIDLPSSHRVTTRASTRLWGPIDIPASHVHIDDHPSWRGLCARVAKELHS